MADNDPVTTMKAVEPARTNDFVWGFLFGCLLHLFQIPMMFFAGALASIIPQPVDSWFVGLFTIGCAVTQLIYMVPTWIIYRRRRRWLFALGLFVNACLFFLLSGLCGWSFATGRIFR